jgi:hypothetical protein
MWPAAATIEAPSLEERQNAAMAELFGAVVKLGLSFQNIAVTRRKAEQRHRELLEKARQLQNDSNVIAIATNQCFGDRTLALFRINAMRAAINVIKEYAEENLEYELRTASERTTRGDRQRDRWFVVSVAQKFKELFGHHMSGLTARIASVALNRKIGPRLVRNWICR